MSDVENRAQLSQTSYSVTALTWRALLLPAAVLVAALAWWGWFRLYTHVTLEDALITYRYAHNLAQGDGFVYNVGERVLGTTTPLLTLILGALGSIAGPETIPHWSSALMTGFGLLTGIVNYLILRRLGQGVVVAAAGMVLFYGAREVTVAAVGGMETALVLFLMALSLYLLLRRRPTFALIVAGILMLVRVDTVIWVAILTGGLLLQERRLPWRGLAMATFIVLPWLVFATAYFGSPLPHSVAAKRVIGPWVEQSLLSWIALREFALWFAEVTAYRLGENMFFLWLLVLGVGFAFLAKERQGRLVASMLGAFVLLYGLFLYVGQAPHFPRYLVPAQWALLLVAPWGLTGLGGLFGNGRAAAVASASLVFLFLWTQNQGFASYHRRFQANEHHLRRAVGLWLRENTSPESSVAMEAIGYQGYFSQRRVIDLAGLVSPEVVAIARDSETNADTFERTLAELKPDYLILRSFEVDTNRHFHGGPLFANDTQRDFFNSHYEEAARFAAPYPELWYDQGHLTVYARRQ